MSDLIENRKRLGSGKKANGALERSAMRGDPLPAADVVRAIVRQMGTDDEAVLNNPMEAPRMPEDIARFRRAALLEVANELGFGQAVEILYAEPLPEGERELGDEVGKYNRAVIEAIDTGHW